MGVRVLRAERGRWRIRLHISERDPRVRSSPNMRVLAAPPIGLASRES